MSQKITFWAISLLGQYVPQGWFTTPNHGKTSNSGLGLAKLWFLLFLPVKKRNRNRPNGAKWAKKTLFELFRPLLGKYVPQGWFTAPNHSKKFDSGLSLAKWWFLLVFYRKNVTVTVTVTTKNRKNRNFSSWQKMFSYAWGIVWQAFFRGSTPGKCSKPGFSSKKMVFYMGFRNFKGLYLAT